MGRFRTVYFFLFRNRLLSVHIVDGNLLVPQALSDVVRYPETWIIYAF